MRNIFKFKKDIMIFSPVLNKEVLLRAQKCFLLTRIKFVVFLITTLLLSVVSYAQQSLSEEADLIFEAKVLKLQQSNMPVNDKSKIAMVKVKRISAGEPILKDYIGRIINVRFKDLDNIKAGKSLVIHGKLLSVGSSLLVKEMKVSQVDKKNLEAIKNFGTLKEQESFTNLISSAENILLGNVKSIKPLQDTSEEDISEHNPHWMQAEIEVKESLKGFVASNSIVRVLYPASTDVMWIRSPKLKVGEEKIFVLGSQPISLSEDKFRGFSLVDKLQVLDAGKKESLKSLLQ